MEKVGKRQHTRTLAPLNLSLEFKVYNIDGDLGVLDEETKKLWFGYNLEPEYVENLDTYEQVSLSPLPPGYGEFKNCTIGGVGKTKRVIGLIRGGGETDKHTVVYASNIEDLEMFKNGIEKLTDEIVTIEEVETCEDEYGTAAKLVCSVENIHIVCANIARYGAKVHISDESVNTFECLGIERLDRREEEPKRAPENWNYSYLPENWSGVPTLWLNLAINYKNCDTKHMPQPLKQYVDALNVVSNSELVKNMEDYKWVSAALEECQTLQLLNSYYILNVEQSYDPIQREMSKLLQYRYLICRGYSARWMGKYDQNALHLGNGLTIRRFKKLNQYSISNLETHVLEKVYRKDGTLQGKGNKGSRSKYVDPSVRYIPSRRMRQKHNLEEIMKKAPAVSEMNETIQVCTDSDDEWETVEYFGNNP